MGKARQRTPKVTPSQDASSRSIPSLNLNSPIFPILGLLALALAYWVLESPPSPTESVPSSTRISTTSTPRRNGSTSELRRPMSFMEANRRIDADLADGALCASLEWLDKLCGDAATVETCEDPLRFNYAILLAAAGRLDDQLKQLQLLRSRFMITNANDVIRRTVMQHELDCLFLVGSVKEANTLAVEWLKREYAKAWGNRNEALEQGWHGRVLMSLLVGHARDAAHHKEATKEMLVSGLDALQNSHKLVQDHYAGWGMYGEKEITRVETTTLDLCPTEFREAVHARQPLHFVGKELVKLSMEQLAQAAEHEERSMRGLERSSNPKIMVSVEAAYSTRGDPTSGIYGIPSTTRQVISCPLLDALADIFGTNSSGSCVGALDRDESMCGSGDEEDEEDEAEEAMDSTTNSVAGVGWSLYLNTMPDGLFPSPKAARPYSSPAHLVRDRLRPPAFLKQFNVHNVNLWLGQGEARSVLHSDGADNLYVVLRGRKRIRLWPPSKSPLAVPSTAFSSISPAGRIDFSHEGSVSDALQSLVLKSARNPGENMALRSEAIMLFEAAYTLELDAGQAVYIPGRWLHEVESFEADGLKGHAAVNFWFQPQRDIDEQTLSWQSRERSGEQWQLNAATQSWLDRQ